MARFAQCFDGRQSMKNNCFEIFHYRDKKPENVNIHHHNFYEVYFFIKGDVKFTVEGKCYNLEHGDLLLLSPMELHQAQIQQGEMYERIVLWIDCDYLKSLGTAQCNLASCFDRSSPNFRNYIKTDKLEQTALLGILSKMNSEFYGSNFASSTYAQALLIQFMVEVNRLSYNAAGAKKDDENDLISNVLNYIGEHFNEPITLEKLASSFFVSKYYLSHEFQQRVGTSVYRYVIFKRLMHARELISEGEPLGNVYEACGFGDYANFYRAFKAEYGISPKQFAQSKK